MMRHKFPLAVLALCILTPGLWALQKKKTAERQPMAGTIVRSKEYIVHRSGHETEEFIGDVSYRQGTREMHADWALFDRDRGIWDAKGHVVAKARLEDGTAIVTHGDLAHYNTVHKDGWLVGKDAGSLISYQYFVYPSTSGPVNPAAAQETFPSTVTVGGVDRLYERDRGTARRLEWNDATSEIALKGAVHSNGDDGELWADASTWNHDKSIIHMNGSVHSVRPDGKAWAQDTVYYIPTRHTVFTGRRPVLTHDEPKRNIAIQGDTIVTDQNPERLTADGQVKGWLWFVKEDAKGKKKKKSKSTDHG